MTAGDPVHAESDDEAVRAVEAAYDAAWNAADVEALVACFAGDAVLVNPRGEVASGRDAIRERLTSFLEGVARGSRHTSRIGRVSFLTRDVALVDGEARLEGGAALGTLEHGFTDVIVRRDGRWLIAHVRAYALSDAGGGTGSAAPTSDRAEGWKFRPEGLDHAALTVRDVARSVAWYQDVLGLERRYEAVWGDFPAIVGAGTTALALFPAPVADPLPPPGRDVLSVRHLAFRVDGATFTRARGHLEACGISPTFEDHEAAHSLYFTDPDGHQLEITTYDLTP